MDMNEQVEITEEFKRPFSDIPSLWLKLPQMTREFFREEIKYTSTSNTLIAVLILAGFIAVFSSLSVLMPGAGGFYGLEDTLQDSEYIRTGGGFSFIQFCCGLIFTPIGFYLANGVIFLGAKLFGGKGDFNQQAYLSSLYYIPLMSLSSVFSFIGALNPVLLCIFGILSIGLSIYHFILNVRSIMEVHSLDTGQAIGGLLLIPGIFILIGVCLIVLLALAGPGIGEIFSNIITELGTPIP